MFDNTVYSHYTHTVYLTTFSMIPSVRTTAYIGVKLKAGSDQVLRAEFYFSTSKCILLLNCPKDAQYNKSEC